MNDAKCPDPRPKFRWLYGFACSLFGLMAITTAFPGIVGFNVDPKYFFAVVLLCCAVFYGAVATTGRFPIGSSKHVQILLCARKYAVGEITLEEYGSQTKQILAE